MLCKERGRVGKPTRQKEKKKVGLDTADLMFVFPKRCCLLFVFLLLAWATFWKTVTTMRWDVFLLLGLEEVEIDTSNACCW